jgi:hypothetical protein
MALTKMIKNLLEFLIKTVFWIITFVLTWFMHIQDNDITPVTSQNYDTHPWLQKMNHLGSSVNYINIISHRIKKCIPTANKYPIMNWKPNEIKITFKKEKMYLYNW